VKAKVKGGLIVSIGVDAFMPASHIDIQPPKNLDQYVGQTYDFKVLKINVERKNIVLSRRELIEEQRTSKRRNLLDSIQPGQVRKGIVKNITDFGAFIDLDGMDGLLHITDMSWGRISHPSEMVKQGEEIQVMIIEVNRDKERVSLGLKQTTKNPWDEIDRKFPVGAKVHGKVVNLVPYGAFIESSPASKASCTSPRCPGPSASPSPPNCSRSARNWTRWSSVSRRTSRRSRSASASSSRIRGTWSATTTRSAPACAARSAT
jgi:small subunit ribosomal protein S1